MLLYELYISNLPWKLLSLCVIILIKPWTVHVEHSVYVHDCVVLTCCRLMSVSGETENMGIILCACSGVWACVCVQGLSCSDAGAVCVVPCVLWIRARFCRVKLMMEGFGLTRWAGRWTGRGDGVNSCGEGAIDPANHSKNKLIIKHRSWTKVNRQKAGLLKSYDNHILFSI